MKKIVAVLFILLVGVGLYTLTIRGVGGNNNEQIVNKEFDSKSEPFELSPERGRFAHVLALAQTGKYALDEPLMRFVYPDVGYYNGNYFSFFAPGISYMAYPLYQLGFKYGLSQVFTFAISSLASILALVFLFLIAKDILKLPTWASVLAPLIFAFATPAWSYAITLYQHHLTTLFIVSGFYFVWKFKQQTKLSFLWALLVGVNYGLALSIDYPNAILFFPVGVYLLLASITVFKNTDSYKIKFRPTFLLAIVGFSIITGLHFWHNKYYYGSPLRLSGSLLGVKDLEANNVLGKSDTEIKEKLAAAAKRKENVTGFFREETLPWGFSVLVGSTDRGIALYAPVILFSLLGIVSFWARKKWSMEITVLCFLVLANLFLYSSWGDPWGGWAFGPRYLIPASAILSLFVVAFLAHGKRVWLKNIIVFPFVLYSSAIALLGALTTNAVPPKIEGVALHAKWNFLYNWDLFNSGQSGSFLYNTYFSQSMPLEKYAAIIYGSLVIIFSVLLFILPFVKRRKSKFEVEEFNHQ